MDSTVCLLMARQCGRDVVSIGVDYGQRHRVELEFAERQCNSRGIERRVCQVRWTKPVGREIPMNRSIAVMAKSVSPAFLPGRNTVFLALGVAEAAGLGATEIWLGVNSIDFSGYPDCRPEFVDAFREVIRQGFPGGPSIIAPLQYMTKPEIARIASELGIGRHETWSCYQPLEEQGTVRPCNGCDACLLHTEAWRSIPSL